MNKNLKQLLKEYLLKETGEWVDDDEGIAWKKHLRDLISPIEDKIDFFQLIDIKGFDKYHGPYAIVKILDKKYEICLSTEGLLWIKNFPIDNTSDDNNMPGFLGTPKEIIDKLYLGFQLPPIKKNKMIKLKESELKNILENILLKEENNNYNPFEDPKANALVNFLIDDQEIEVGFVHILPLKYDHYGLSMYKVKDREYAVGTDEEANKAAAEEIKEFAWSFNEDFIIRHSSALDFDGSERILTTIQEHSEDANPIILKLIDNIDEFIEDAIQSDGRGHLINSYDGEEHEKELNGTYYYIYRTG